MVAEALDAIAQRLVALREEPPSELTSGERAALWRAQQDAARPARMVEDLRRYCLESLRRPRFLDAEHENDYLRGYRRGFQLVLREVRRIETARRQ